MSRDDFQIAIIGGGIGGLCLAQGLKKAGIGAEVYERDETPSSRLQGFRIHIDPEGSRALHECLPEDLWDVFDQTVRTSRCGMQPCSAPNSPPHIVAKSPCSMLSLNTKP
jgi:flavin-dependent dehydrogenase